MIALYLLCLFPAPNFKLGLMGTANRDLSKTTDVYRSGQNLWGQAAALRYGPGNRLSRTVDRTM